MLQYLDKMKEIVFYPVRDAIFKNFQKLKKVHQLLNNFQIQIFVLAINVILITKY